MRLVPEDLAAEKRALKLSRLRRRQSRPREHLNDLIRKLSLFFWKHRRVAVPTQTSANVLVDPRALTRDLICESVQVPDLIEQGMKLFVGNRHDRPGIRPLSNKSFPTPPLVLPHQHEVPRGIGLRSSRAPRICSRSSIVSATIVSRSRAFRGTVAVGSSTETRELMNGVVRNTEADEHHRYGHMFVRDPGGKLRTASDEGHMWPGRYWASSFPSPPGGAIGLPAPALHPTRSRVFRCPDQGTPCVPGVLGRGLTPRFGRALSSEPGSLGGRLLTTRQVAEFLAVSPETVLSPLAAR